MQCPWQCRENCREHSEVLPQTVGGIATGMSAAIPPWCHQHQSLIDHGVTAQGLMRHHGIVTGTCNVWFPHTNQLKIASQRISPIVDPRTPVQPCLNVRMQRVFWHKHTLHSRCKRDCSLLTFNKSLWVYNIAGLMHRTIQTCAFHSTYWHTYVAIDSVCMLWSSTASRSQVRVSINNAVSLHQ